MYKVFLLLFQLPLILFFLSFSVSAATHYISTTGTDHNDCSGGTYERPWETWKGPESRGCIRPGDTVYFKAGTYTASGSTFKNSVWKIQGESSGANITIAPDPAASGAWPVKIAGKIKIFGKYAVIEGIEFNGADDAIKNFASYITFKNNYIHSATSDCVRILSVQQPDRTHNTDISLIGNTIFDCKEDAVDNVGAKNVVIRGNDIFDYRNMQIKGGTENLLIEDNTFHGSESIFSGNNMNCGSEYCGNPTLPTLPVSDRYVAKNVIIRNNLFYNLSSSASTGIKMNGWKDSQVYNNTFYNLGNSWAILLQGNMAGLNYFDSTTADYCKSNKDKCKSCGSDCYVIKHDPDNIQIRNNIFLSQKQMVNVDSASTNITLSNNIYWNNGSSMLFMEHGRRHSSVETFTLESNSYQQSPGLTDAAYEDFTLTENSVAINNGYALLAPPTDYMGDPRDSKPDIGAYEYQGTNSGPPPNTPKENQYTITTSTQGNGTINLSPVSDTYDEGTSVTITATPSADYQFDHWEGGISGSDNPLDITVTNDMKVTAVFIGKSNPGCGIHYTQGDSGSRFR